MVTYEFDRYINGRLMAEGVTVERAKTLEEAMVIAARIASRGPNREVPVLVLRTTLRAQLAEARNEALDAAQVLVSEEIHRSGWVLRPNELAITVLAVIRALKETAE